MNGITAGSIGARGYHTARLGPASDGKRLANQRRIALFFNSAKEGIQVEMNDLAVQGSGSKKFMG